jgi:hypothetical protein
MRDIYNYIPETNYISSMYGVVAILSLQFIIHVMLFATINVLYFYISRPASRTVCAVPNMAVFCSYLILLLLLLLYFCQ